MLTMHPTLLIGPADWDATRMPRHEFFARTAKLWEVGGGDVAGAIVFGSPQYHAELAWLTHFTPKLEPGLALIERSGAIRLFVGGGANMLDAARSLTFVEELLPLRGAAAAIAEWVRRLGGAGRLALIGGDAMSFDFHHDIAAALGKAANDITPLLAPLMRRKSEREFEAIRQSCATLDAALDAIGVAWLSGAGVTAAILAGEQAADLAGAQDVRALFSLDGGHTLVPFTTLIERRVDPLQVYVAVRQHGYWVDGFQMFCNSPNAAFAAARAAIMAGTVGVRHGKTTVAELASEVAAVCAAGGRRLHPVVAGALVTSAGLSLEAAAPPESEVFARDSVYSLRAGAIIGSEAAILSATLYF